jgi:antibiotic biosynthesis monooxygenase (ABM) superfamily enzyme
VQRLTGLETWFALPASATITPPPRWKQALLSWLGGYPTASLFFVAVGTHIQKLPLPVRTLILSSFLILTLTYVVMPRLTSVARRWLYPR